MSQNKIEKFSIEKDILFFDKNIINLKKLSYYNHKKEIAIIDGVKVDIKLPKDIYEMIKIIDLN